MDKQRMKLWYLLDWPDRDKCLLAATFFGILQLCYWLLLNLVARYTDFGHHYIADAGLAASQWVMLGGELIWLFLIAWGEWLRRRQRESRLYVTGFLYLFGLPLLALGHMVGLYNPVLGVILLGSVLTGIVLFDFRRIVGPFLTMLMAISALAWLTVDYRLEYAPLLRLDPVSKFHISGIWILLMMVASTPFLLGVFTAVWLLLSRWREREEMVRFLSNTDTLTGLPNRRALFTRIEHELNRARRRGEAVALAMMDIDHFKQVNDTYGHAAGDRVLKQLGESIPHLLRNVDLFGRIGGEEFVILLPDTGREGAKQVLERCREMVASSPVTLEDGRMLNITASFGLSTLDRMTLELGLGDLLELADRALYRAKHQGRNRVEMQDANKVDGKSVLAGH